MKNNYFAFVLILGFILILSQPGQTQKLVLWINNNYRIKSIYSINNNHNSTDKSFRPFNKHIWIYNDEMVVVA